jgi:hypothetical protein
MKTDTVLKVEAMTLLIKRLGELDAECFVSLVKSDRFDYTKWQRDLWKDKTIDDIYGMAVDFEQRKAASREA